MKRRSMRTAFRIGSLSLLLLAGIAAGETGSPRVSASRAEAFRALHRAAAQADASPVAGGGHPTQELADRLIAHALAADDRGTNPVFNPADPPDAALEEGPFVNFESPVTKGVVVSADGERVYAVHTPNNSISVIDASGPVMSVIRNIPVGLDPVSLAWQPTPGAPGDEGRYLWVANYISDNVSVVDVRAGQVVRIIEVGDRPVNILFNSAGTHAFIVCEGTPALRDTSPGVPAAFSQEGALVAVDAASGAIVNSRWLDMNTPRAAVYDPTSEKIIVAALHSGNNTSVVGRTVLHDLDVYTGAPDGSIDVTESWPDLAVPFFMPSLAAPWASAKLTPWPNPEVVEGKGADLLERVVGDNASPGHPVDNPWPMIVDILSTPAGLPEPAMVAEYKAQFESFWALTHPGQQAVLVNASDIIQETINDARDTLDHDLAIIDVSSPGAPTGLGMSHVENVGASITGMARAQDGTLFLTNLDPDNTTRSEENLRGRFVNHEVVRVANVGGPGQSVAPFDLHASEPNFDDVSAPNPTAKAIALANPTDVTIASDGSVFVAAFGTGRLARLDANGNVLARVEVGEFSGPRSLVLDEARRYLYSLDRITMSVSRVSIAGDSFEEQDRVMLMNTEPVKTRNGRKFLYSTRFANNYSSSCSSCHFESHLDQRAWDLSGTTATALLHLPHIPGLPGDLCIPDPNAYNHPVKGPMVTLSLRGLKGRNPFHWRGDKAAFQDFNEAFVKLLGAQSQLSTGDMDLYTDFIETVAYEPTYYRNRDNTFKDSGAIQGRTMFLNACNGCHALDDDGALRLDCVPEDMSLNFLGAPIFAQVEEITQLRGINQKFHADRYNGFGLIHDGREKREHFDHPMKTFLANFFPGLLPNAGKMIAFLDAFQSNVMPCVGEQFLWTSGSPSAGAKLDAMIVQQGLIPTRCDIVVTGVVGGSSRGYWMSVGGANPVFQSDSGQNFSRAQLQALVNAGAVLTVTAVPPGSGYRIGVNWDLDCRSNFNDDLPLVPDGDTNDDRVATFADITTILANWGKMNAPVDLGDVTGEGDVNFADITRVLSFWNQPCPPPPGHAQPGTLD